jgi:predicted dehydrogenase
MTRQYRAAVIGLSWISIDSAAPASHPVLGSATPYSHVSAMSAVPGVELVAGCDISQAACEAFRERWAHRWPNLKTYTDYRQLLANESVEVLGVATPDHLHADIVVDAAAAGVKGIFCEKPLATDLADADRMIQVARKHGVVMTINHTRRWNPDYVAARERIRAGDIGPVSQIIVRTGGPRAMLFRNHTHAIDLICYFAETDPEWVMAELEAALADYGTVYRGDGGRDPNMEPGVNAYIAFQDGIRGYLSGMKTNYQELSVQVIGSKGRIDIGSAGVTLSSSNEKGSVTLPIRPAWSRAGMEAAVVDLIHALETGSSTQSPPEEARKTVAIITAILESQATGHKPVPVK